MPPSGPLARFLRQLGPSMPFLGLREALRASIGAFAGLGLLAVAVIFLARHDYGLFMIAPFGASAVLLFAVPNSPLAQPWSAMVGNLVSGLAGVGAVFFVADPALCMAVAVGGAIFAMHLCNALHPPGGAVALTAALSAEQIRELGWNFALSPVLAGTACLAAVAVIWARLTGRRYPFRQQDEVNRHGTTDNVDRLQVTRAELAGILQQFRQTTNIGVEDLARLVGAVEMLAAQHQMEGIEVADVMSRDLVTVAPDTRLSNVARLFRDHGFTSLPVVGPDARYLGLIFQIHLIRRGQEVAERTDQGFLRSISSLLSPQSGTPPSAAQVMSVTVPSVAATAPLAEVLPLLARSDCDAVPVLEGQRIIGIVTRTDLIDALAHRQANLLVQATGPTPA